MYQAKSSKITKPSKDHLDKLVSQNKEGYTHSRLESLWMGDRNALRTHLSTYKGTPIKFNQWLANHDIPKHYYVDENNVELYFYPFIEQLAVTVDGKKIEFSSSFNDKTLTDAFFEYIQLIRLLHVDETSSTGNSIQTSFSLLSKYSQKTLAESLPDLSKLTKHTLSAFHGDYVFDVHFYQGNSSEDFQVLSQPNKKFIESTACGFGTKTCTGKDALFSKIAEKEMKMRRLLKTVQVCINDELCKPDLLADWFNHLGQLYPPLTYWQPQNIENEDIQAIQLRKDNWIQAFLNDKKHPAEILNKIKKAILWPQVKKIHAESSGSTYPKRLELLEQSISANIPANDEPYLHGSAKARDKPHPRPQKTIKVIDFTYTLNNYILSSLKELSEEYDINEQVPVLGEDIKLIFPEENDWKIAISSKQITKFLRANDVSDKQIRTIKLTVTIDDDSINQLWKSFFAEHFAVSDNQHNGTLGYRDVNVHLSVGDKEFATVFKVEKYWPSWFAQPVNDTLSKYFLMLTSGFVVCILVFGYRAGQWPYKLKQQPKRKKVFAYITLLFFPSMLTLILYINPPQIVTTDSYGERLDIYVPYHKVISDQEFDVIFKLLNTIEKTYKSKYQACNLAQDFSQKTWAEIGYCVWVAFFPSDTISSQDDNHTIKTPVIGPPPLFRVIAYNWNHSNNLLCENGYQRSVSEAIDCLKKKKGALLKMEPACPSIYGNACPQAKHVHIDKDPRFYPTESIVIYDGDHGKLDSKLTHSTELFADSGFNSRVKSIFIPTPTRSDNISLEQRVKFVATNSDTTCVLASDRCLKVDSAKLSDEVKRYLNSDKAKELALPCEIVNRDTNCDNQERYNLVAKRLAFIDVDAFGSDSTLEDVSAWILSSYQGRFEHATKGNSDIVRIKVVDQRYVYIILLSALFILLMLYYHKNGSVQLDITRSILAILAGVIVVSTFLIFVYFFGVDKWISNGADISTSSIYIYLVIVAVIVISCFLPNLIRLLLLVSNHPYVLLNRDNVDNSELNLLSTGYTGYKKYCYLFFGELSRWVCLVLITSSVLLWAISPTAFYPEQFMLLGNYNSTLFIAASFWTLAVILFYINKER
ncbi:hypothetical protein [Pseudoalteromonas luteoviolacea]|uniref:hypothetical protein n=1 Tax=Pseudoalteromonas luteoviolacea TaxID=43657 RepID=UPI0011AB7275|nr:hypothetical protein [Pseudoalteromonas luteoviolacea]